MSRLLWLLVFIPLVAALVAACASTGGSVSDTPTAAPLPAQIAELRAQLAAAEPAQYDAVVQAWIDSQAGIPIVDASSAVFVWLGDEADVKMVGDATGWDQAASPALVPLEVEGVALQYLEQRYPSAARLDYKLVVGGAWNLDPLNPRTMLGGFGPNSELAMPDYHTPAEVVVDGQAPMGVLTPHSLQSQALGDTRSFSVYVPPAPAQLTPEEAAPEALLVFHDGGDYLNLIGTQVILDRLVASGDLPPLVAVFAPPNDRFVDYNRNDAYVAYLADELVPFMRETYDVGSNVELTGTIGPSMGGLIACYVALSRPDVFGLAACQSGAYSLDEDALIEQVKASEAAPVRLHLVVGTFELAVGGGGDEGDLLAAQRRLVAALEDKRYAFQSEEHPQGHSWGLWRDRLPAALRYLYGGP